MLKRLVEYDFCLIGSGCAHSCASAIAIDLANCSASLQNYFENG